MTQNWNKQKRITHQKDPQQLGSVNATCHVVESHAETPGLDSSVTREFDFVNTIVNEKCLAKG